MSAVLILFQKLIAENRGLSPLTQEGIDESYMKKDELKVFSFMRHHYTRHGALPQITTIERSTKVKFPKPVDEPIGYWIEQVKERYATDMIHDTMSEVKDVLSENEVTEAIQLIKQLAIGLQLANNQNVVNELSSLIPVVVKHHDDRRVSPRMSGVTFGFPYLDSISDGAQPTDTVALVGRPSVGKTYIMLVMAVAAWLNGEVPLLHSMEMSPKQCAMRLTGILVSLSTTLLRMGMLSTYARTHFLDERLAQLSLPDRPPFYITKGAVNGTVEDLAVLIQEKKPSIVYVDGAYMLKTGNKGHGARWETVSDTAEYLKRVATDMEIPVIATYQFNRKGPGNLDNIGYSDSIGQLASIVCGIEEEDPKSAHSGWHPVTFKLLKLLKGREGEKGTIRIMYDMRTMDIRQDSIVED